MVTPRIVVTTDLEAGGMYRAVAAPADPDDNGKLPYAAAGDLAYLAHGPAGYPLVATGSGFDWLNALGDITVDSLTSVGAIDGPVTAASLPLFGAAVRGAVPPSGGGTTNYLRADGTWTAPSAVVAISTANVAFTDGDTARRVTITDAAVSAASKVLCSVRRPDTTDDSADRGYLYIPNVVKCASGSFDVLIACLDIGGMDPTEKPPSETITLLYQVA